MFIFFDVDIYINYILDHSTTRSSPNENCGSVAIFVDILLVTLVTVVFENLSTPKALDHMS